MKDVNLLIGNGVNVTKSLELFGDMATYDDTLIEFLAEVEEKLAKIKAFKEQGDMANYSILVHSLKSDARYFGFDNLAEQALNHELQSKANNLYYVTDNYESLITEANRIITLVKQYMGQEVNLEVKETAVVKDKSILVADDSNVIVNFVHNIFDAQYNVLVAKDGQEAINYIESDQRKSIVAMLLDLNMPNVNGFEVLEYFKQKDLFSSIPVSIITGETSREGISRVFSYPIVDVLNKPFNEINVKNILEKTINMRVE